MRGCPVGRTPAGFVTGQVLRESAGHGADRSWRGAIDIQSPFGLRTVTLVSFGRQGWKHRSQYRADGPVGRQCVGAAADLEEWPIGTAV